MNQPQKLYIAELIVKVIMDLEVVGGKYRGLYFMILSSGETFSVRIVLTEVDIDYLCLGDPYLFDIKAWGFKKMEIIEFKITTFVYFHALLDSFL